VLQPVLLRPVPGGTYELIAGERRWRAAQLAGFETVPALVRAHDDAESLELALIENMAREDLNPVEEARACALLVEELGLTREDIGRRVGRSRVAVSNLLRLLDLPDEVLDLLAAGHLTEGHGRALLTASDHDARRRLARSAVQEGWTVRQTEARARDGSRRSAPRHGRGPSAPPHPDQVEAARRLADALGRALGADVQVAPRGHGYRVVLDLEDPAAAELLAARLGALEPA
jgi:ParB family transcriptional regulator, chromosome partitioning protein